MRRFYFLINRYLPETTQTDAPRALIKRRLSKQSKLGSLLYPCQAVCVNRMEAHQ